MVALALVLSVLIGVSLGLLGGGGSILTTPILIYALGVEPKQAIATSLLVVCITSLSGMLQHARKGNVAWRTGLVFGAAGMAGAYLGGLAAGWIPAGMLMGLFAAMMLITAVAMFRGRKDVTPGPEKPAWMTLLIGLLVGAVTGLVGAGGGFVVVPALVLLAGLPMQRAVGTSLLVIVMNTAAGYAGHASHVTVDFPLVGLMSTAAVFGSLVGSRLVSLVSPSALRRGFAGFVLVMAGFVLFQQM